MGAIVYDSLLLLAVLFLATAVALPINGGQAFDSGQFFYPAYLLLVSLIFFAWFWCHGGQTLGMRAWKIQLVTNDGEPVEWHAATIRFLSAILSWACCGLGFLWSLLDRDRLCWHDKLSSTRLIFKR